MEQHVKGITRHLLNSGAFNHLLDAELSRMQWLLLRREAGTNADEQLMHFWYYADFYAAGVPQFLLHECNLVLQHHGKPVIDVFPQAALEA
ncbi:MAG TPA: hypothetical protein PKE63_02210 [Lacibacter sp.]|nr:hypothetical protein [Lacibacter sp.]HMO90432.1 hypothetical protein [Lacibacter sp.]HMP86059.1 hypothetical protein [Lacibacter sp.]